MDISLTGYIQKTSLKFQYPSPKNPEYSPFKEYLKQYGSKVQFLKEEDSTPELSASVIKIWQQKIGCLLFYGRNVYMMLLVALITLLSTQSNVIEETAQAMMQLLNYCTTYPDAFIRYKTIDMILEIHSDAS